MRARSVDFAPIAAAVNDHGRCVRPKQLPARLPRTTRRLPVLGPWATRDDRRGGGLLAIGAEPPVRRLPVESRRSLAALGRRRPRAGRVRRRRSRRGLGPARVGRRRQARRRASHQSPLATQARRRRRATGRRPIGDCFPARTARPVRRSDLPPSAQLRPASAAGGGQRRRRESGGRRGATRPLGANRVYVHCGETCTREYVARRACAPAACA